jgi:hypothetical protein
MDTIQSENLLKSIAVLELKKKEQEQDLIVHFKKTKESLKPLNLIKNGFKGMINSPDVKDNLLNASMGMGAGIASKKILFGRSSGIIKNVVGSAVELAVANLVSSKGNFIKEKGMQLISYLIAKRKEQKNRITY